MEKSILHISINITQHFSITHIKQTFSDQNKLDLVIHYNILKLFIF